METQNYFIVITGPTGVGKTDFANKLVEKLNGKAEIVNSDLGQFYTPLNIGTAKPDNIDNQHLFNIINEPKNFTVLDYRKILIECLNNLWQKGITPIIVGGSSFYIKSIFYPPIEYQDQEENEDVSECTEDMSECTNEKLLEILRALDPERAKKIALNDRYRLERALWIWKKTGQKPSALKPKMNPIGYCSFYYINRDREDLYERINSRVIQMFDKGWIHEVEQLNDDWRKFLKEKKIIGYPEIINYIESNKAETTRSIIDKEELIETIARKSRAYAKRQLTFWKSMCKLLVEDVACKNYIKEIKEINLTKSSIDLYIDKYEF